MSEIMSRSEWVRFVMQQKFLECGFVCDWEENGMWVFFPSELQISEYTKINLE